VAAAGGLFGRSAGRHMMGCMPIDAGMHRWTLRYVVVVVRRSRRSLWRLRRCVVARKGVGMVFAPGSLFCHEESSLSHESCFNGG
jgi:hypothetical protein